jgi:Ca2+-binding RTX toxin-like protein
MQPRQIARDLWTQIEPLESRRLLDGSVGAVDLSDFDRLLGRPVSSQWSPGDFDYNGTVNLADFNLLASSFGLSASGPGVTAADWAALAGSVGSNDQPSYTVEGRTLVVRGTPKADQILIDADKLAELKRLHPSADIRRISVDAGAGDDSITIAVGIISTVTGARGNDTIVGSARGDHLSGSAGDDVVLGGRGDDRLDGIDGRDHLEGGIGNDSLSGGKGHDTLMGNDGDDALSGGGGTDRLFGGRGRDSFKAGDILGNADQLGFDRRGDVMISSDADDDHVRDER